MKDWLRRTWEEHPWLTTLVAVYLLLSAVELVRILLYDRPRTYDAGTYAWETAPGPDGSRGTRFRWTGAEAAFLRPVEAPILHVPLRLTRPDMPGERVAVSIRVDERLVEDLVLENNGWFEVEGYLPPVIGPELWADVEAGWRELEEARAREAARPPPSNWLVRWWRNWQELKPWHPPPGPPSVWIDVEVDSPFVPSELAEDSDDDRTLGVGVGEIAWREALPPEGHGFYGWETHADGTRFRWTRRWASQPLPTLAQDASGETAAQASSGKTAAQDASGETAAQDAAGEAEGSLRMSIRANHPDLEERPVEVRIYWGPQEVIRETLTDSSWRELVLPPPPSAGAAVLTFEVGHTWSPREEGISEDARDLGIMVSEIRRAEGT